MSMLFVIYSPVNEPEAISKVDAFGSSKKISVAALYKRYQEQIRHSRSGAENTAPTPMPDQPSQPPTTATDKAKRRFFGGQSKKKSETMAHVESRVAVKSSLAAGVQHVTTENSDIIRNELHPQSSDRSHNYISEEKSADEFNQTSVTFDDSNFSRTTDRSKSSHDDEVLTLREVG